MDVDGFIASSDTVEPLSATLLAGVEAWMTPCIVVSQSFSLAASTLCLAAVVVLLASFLSCAGWVGLFAGDEVEVLGRRTDSRSAVVRDAASDSGPGLRVGGCEVPGLAGLTFTAELQSVELDVDDVLDRLVVLLDVEATLAGSLCVLPPPPLPPGPGISISCTSTTIRDRDFTPAPPFETELEAESTEFAALPEGDDGASLTFRSGPGPAMLFVWFTVDGLFAFFWPAEGSSISCKLDGARDLARLVTRRGDVAAVSLTPLCSVAAVRCSDDDDSLTLDGRISSIASTLPRTDVAASAAAAAAA